ncbi:MAG TPA: SRPBCC family protein [Candidatus Kapabacteria bacterium]|nr:SRPBCC family protein [Candidatus Kapabacteria bacterium]
MDHVEKSIEVEAPLSMVYNQWTQFEEFPRFMEGVEEVRQLDEKRLRWRAEIAGKVVEWDAEIFEQIPDRRVAWRSTTGALNSGMVNFEPTGPNRTKIWLKLNYKPEGAMEKIGSALGIISQRVEGDLERFKEFIESRGSETGAWRGQIEGRHVESTPNQHGSAEAMPRSQRHTGSTEIPSPLRTSKPSSVDTQKNS